MSQSPLTKKLRLETTTETKLQSNNKNDMLAGMLDLELQRYILTFLVHDASGHKKWIYPSVRRGMITTMKKCTLVCKTWRDMTNQLINEESSIPALLSTAELIDIKTKMDRVDLAPVRTVFIQQVRDKWGHVIVGSPHGEATRALDLFLYYFHRGCFEIFARRVESMYRTLLIVKAVETYIASKNHCIVDSLGIGTETKGENPVKDTWLEKCCPSNIVNLFWNAHMVFPAKYGRDCQMLIGQIIDHDPGYGMGENPVKGSSFEEKKLALFQFELKTVPPRHDNVDTVFKSTGSLATCAIHLLMEMEVESDCG